MRCRILSALGLQLLFGVPLLSEARTAVPLIHNCDLDTYYVSVCIGPGEPMNYLVDTGAGYMTITGETFEQLQAVGDPTFVRNVRGRMANGTLVGAPVYRVSKITVGGTCTLRDVEVAVLSGAPRGLFGLSALRQAAPFEVSLDPPSLMLSNCVEALSAPAQDASCSASPRVEAQRSCIEPRFDPLVHP